MKLRPFSEKGPLVSEVGLGTWQLGGSEWGEVPEESALAVLQAAAECGVTFLDTADIYGSGRSESLIGRFLKGRTDADRFFVATKFGRRPDPGWPGNFDAATIRLHTEQSLQRLGVEAIDLTQAHCIPEKVMRRDAFWDGLRDLKTAGKIRAFGASVESVEEGLDCLQIDGLDSLQIIFNVFRQKPLQQLLQQAQARGVAIIVRLPLASGLLAGKWTRESRFGERDHRTFNADGQAFNVGETFAGLPFERGVELVEQMRPLVPQGWLMSEWALRWCLDFPQVTTVIPGATKVDQVRSNARASDLTPLPASVHATLRQVYDEHVSHFIRGKY